MKQKSCFWSTSLLVLLLMFMAGCSGEEAQSSDMEAREDESIKVGVILSLTGPVGWLGENTQRAIETLSKQLNESGGIDGRQIELVYVDDESSPEGASRGARRLVNSDNVDIIIGPNGTPTSNAVEQIVASAEIPMISMSGGYIPNPEVGWGWSVVHSTEQVIRRQFQYFADEGITRVGVINPNDALGQIANTAIEEYSSEFNIEVVQHETFNLDDINVQPQLNSIMSNDAEVVIAFVSGEPAVTVRRQMNELGFNVPMFAPHSSATLDFLSLIGSIDDNLVMAAGGIITAYEAISNDHPQKEVIDEFVSNFKAEHGYPPGYVEGFGYDALNVAYHAIKEIGTNPDDLKAFLENGENEIIGVNGVFNYSKDNRIGLSTETLRILEIRNNEWKLVD